MINIFLPNFNEYLELNNFFINLQRENKDKQKMFKFKNLNFSYIHGSFNYCYWNGLLNSNHGLTVMYDDFLYYSNKAEVPLSLNFSNICLENCDFYDSMGNTILKLLENGSNIIELSNLDFMKYINEKYPFYKFILSSNYFLINKNIDYKELNENENIKFIIIPDDKRNDLDFLNQFNKNKIILGINPICDINCQNLSNCIFVNNLSQYNYSNMCPQFNCNKINIYNNNSYILNIEQYVKKGYHNFLIYEDINIEFEKYFNLLFDLFIKDEYKQEVMSLWNQR